MKKLLIFPVIILSIAFSVSAQDAIITVNRDTIYCQIIRIDDASVEYQIVRNGIRETNTLPRRYVADFSIAERDENGANLIDLQSSELQISRFRWAVAAGYAYRLGRIPPPSGSPRFDELFKKIRPGVYWETDLQYFFNHGNGIGLTINGVHSSASGQNIDIPELGQVSHIDIKQHVFYVGPAWATRLETDRFLFSGSLSPGVIIFTESTFTTLLSMQMTSVVFGMNYGIGAEYKLSPNYAVGLKAGYTLGSVSELKFGGQTVKLDEPVSLSNFTIGVHFSFRTK
jgi:opacity protein-like surface antigen